MEELVLLANVRPANFEVEDLETEQGTQNADSKTFNRNELETFYKETAKTQNWTY